MATRKSFLLRINAELWDELSRWAAEEFRSVNGQIEYVLQRAVDERRGRRRESVPEAPGRGDAGWTEEDAPAPAREE